MSAINGVIMNKPIVLLQRIKIFGCKKCPKAFTTFSDYKHHKVRHVLQNIQKERREKNKKIYKPISPGYEKRFKCDECDMKFVEKSTLVAHSALHKPFPHVCKCGVGFYVNKDLNCHKKIVHAEEEDISKKERNNEKENKFKNKTNFPFHYSFTSNIRDVKIESFLEVSLV